MHVAAPSLYVIDCACGTRARGERLPKPQVVTCKHCGQQLFVFPLTASPFENASGSSIFGADRAAWRERLRFWLAPAVAGLLALAVVGTIVLAIVRSHRPAVTTQPLPSTVSAEQQFVDRLAAARIALADGSYHLALRELDAAHELYARFPRQFDTDKSHELARWRRQVALLADLLPESVNEIVRHSIGLPDREWDAVFRERYAGKVLLLDTHVFRDATGRYRVDYHLEAAGAVGVWQFDQFKLFARLPLAHPQRLLFGFRLQAVRKTARDRWIVVPEPDSGVLLTDPLLLAGLSVPADAELLEVLRRQAEWDADE